MRILFTPIGQSDPICSDHDGPALHCCRLLQPDLCVLFLTKEIMENIGKEKIEKTFMLLSDWLIAEKKREEPIRVEFLEHPEIDNPQLDDIFYPLFEKALRELNSRYHDAEIYCGAGSGTPAMKSCVISMFHFLPFDTVLCQVDSPVAVHREQAQRGTRNKVDRNYEPELYWEFDHDNEPNAAPRLRLTTKSDLTPLGRKLFISELKTLIGHQEYESAKELVSDPECILKEKQGLIRALEGAVYRMQWNLKLAGTRLSETGEEVGKRIGAELIKYEKDPVRRAAEALLTMEIDLKRGEYGDLMRKLTPVLFTLCCALLKAPGGVNVEKWLGANGKLRLELVEKTAPDCLRWVREADGKYLSVNYLLELMREKLPRETFDRICALRAAEERVRNQAAHSMASIQENSLKETAAAPEDVKSYDELTELLWRLAAEAAKGKPYRFDREYRSSYETMSDFIVGLITE